jgi:hypothetical protein
LATAEQAPAPTLCGPQTPQPQAVLQLVQITVQ